MIEKVCRGGVQRGLLRAVALTSVVISVFAAEPRVLTVDNNPGAVAMFSDIAAAYQAAEEGDTLLVAGSPTTYGTITLRKRLHIIGAGYFLTENGIPGVSRDSSTLNISFDGTETNSASGSTIVGLSGTFQSSAKASGVIIDKCHITTSFFDGQVTIRRSYCADSTLVLRASESSVRNSILVSLNLQAENCTVSNCVITGVLQAWPSTSISSCIFTSASTPESFAQNVKGSVSHCIAIGGDFLPAGGDNIENAAFESVFVSTGILDPNFSPDGKWRLKAGSPAIGAGVAGTDIGAFGGPSPYVLSGVPALPRVTRLVVPAIASDSTGLRFEVDAQSF